MTSTLARAFWIAAPGRGEIRHERLEPPGDGDLLVRAEFSGISRGTESLVFAGRVPASEYDRMRAPFQEGGFPAPVKYGYASVGVVESGPPEWLGSRVFVLHPHQTHYVVPQAAAYRLPDGVPASRAVLAANVETALNGAWDARPQIGDRITIIGAGVVGTLVAWLLKGIAHCDVTLVDINPRRREIAEAIGVTFSSPDAVSGAAADLVLHASGSEAGLAVALGAAAFEATVIEMSWYGNAMVSAPLGEAFHSKRLTLKSSQVGHVAASQRPRWTHRRRMELALSMMTDPVLDRLISGESDFEQLPTVMPRLAVAPEETLCHRIRYSNHP